MNARRVLVVDDDVDLLQILTIRLRRAGYAVAAAEDGRQALAVLDTFMPDAVVTDLRMAEMDGLALFEAIKRVHPTLPVIVLTAHGTISDAVAATTRGVFQFLTKPFDSETLLETIERAVHISGGMAATESDAAWRAEIVTRSPLMEEVLKQAQLAARSEVSVIVQSQSGTGKELLARAIHRASRRAARPFVPVDCTAIPEALFESELFGYRKGSFSGAVADREGLFQAANEGTLFLDEIGEMPLYFQAKLLRALQEQEIRPVGAQKTVPIDIRVIAATHRDLESAVATGRFREDLYYRLNVVTLELPNLAQRREDIPLLCRHFIERACTAGAVSKSFAPDAMARLVAAPWPGNVRQLQNVVEQCIVLCDAPVVPASLVERALRGRNEPLLPFAQARDRFERAYLVELLRATEGNVSHAARLAERNRSEFYKLLGKHSLEPELFRRRSDASC
jgi:two-component system response regulator GlrR